MAKTDAPLPYYRWFWQDWRSNRTVQRMGYVERGLYRELLDECWVEGSIPEGIDAMADICGCPVDVMANAWQVLGKCFHLVDGRYHNEKLDSLRTERDAVRVKRKDSGRLGGIRKALNQNDSVANARQVPDVASVCHIEEKRIEEKSIGEKRIISAADAPPKQSTRGERLPSDWTLPDDWKPDATTEGIPVGAVDLEGRKFRDYWVAKSGKDATKMDWRATWRNWCRTAASRTYRGGGGNGPNRPAGLSAVERAKLDNEQHRAKRDGGRIFDG